MSDPVVITLRDGQGYLTGLPPEVVEPLTMATSFRPAGYQYTKLFKRGKTDGRVKLFKHSKFPAGLVQTITDVLTAHEVQYALDVEAVIDTKPNLLLKAVGIESRPYQDDAVEAALLNPRGIIRAPTGAGKTAIGARIIVARGKWALVIVPTIDLLHQYRRFLGEHLEWFGFGDLIEVGQLGDGVVDPREVTVATVRTAAAAFNVAYERYEYGEYDDKDDTVVHPSELREWIEKIGTLLVDEAHILGAQTVFDIATKLPAPNKYGMSASPWRDDGADLMIEAATGRPIYRIGTEELVKSGHLVPPIIEVVDTKSWWVPAAWGQTCSRCGRQRWNEARGPVKKCSCGNETWQSEFTPAYKHEIVDNLLRNLQIAELVMGRVPLAGGPLTGPSLVLVKQVKHGKTLEALIDDSTFLSGKDPGSERVRVYDAMRAGEVKVVIATTIADLGLDLPILRNLVLAGGGKSSTRHLQRIGRVARPYPGKTHARVIDFDDGHVHKWFRDHAKARRKIEKAEWGKSALWL